MPGHHGARAGPADGPLTIGGTSSEARRSPLLLPTAAALGVAVVGLDQWTKFLIARDLGPGAPTDRIGLVGSWFALEYVQNRGAAFGLFGGASGVVAAGAAVILVGVVAYAASRRLRTVWLAMGVGLVAGGALGNLIDRVRLGYVVDFVAIGVWPNFNVADAAISLGVVCLACDVLLPTGHRRPAEVGQVGDAAALRAERADER